MRRWDIIWRQLRALRFWEIYAAAGFAGAASLHDGTAVAQDGQRRTSKRFWAFHTRDGGDFRLALSR
jgi:hypothetical protein